MFLCIRFIATILGSYFDTGIGIYFEREYPMSYLYYLIMT